MSDDFVRDLEAELVAAARFRAEHPAPRFSLPRISRRAVFSAMTAGAVAALAIAAVLAVSRGGGERAADAPPAPPGVTIDRGGECREVAPALRDRVTALAAPAQPGLTLPRAAIPAVEEQQDFDAILFDAARRWGGGDGVEFWVVPVAPKGGSTCAPATQACVVGVAGERADALCSDGPDAEAVKYRMSPLPGGRGVIFGFVPDRATSVTVEVAGRTAKVDAGLNVFGGVLPFPVSVDDNPLPEADYASITGSQQVRVVDAGGNADVVAYRLSEAGFGTTGVTAGATPQEQTAVYWRPGRVSREDVARIAALAGATQQVAIDGGARTPRPVQDAHAPVVVVVGTG